MPRSTCRKGWGAGLIGAAHRHVVLALVAGAVPLSAQSVPQRAQIEAFRDSVGAASDSASLLGAQRALIGHASQE
jgi:hypothetical protein